MRKIRVPFVWENTIAEPKNHRRRLDALPGKFSFTIKRFNIFSDIISYSRELARCTKQAIERHKELLVIGGDHSCAVGTWSGVAAAKQKQGRIGLLWIDAHLDAHVPATSPSGNVNNKLFVFKDYFPGSWDASCSSSWLWRSKSLQTLQHLSKDSSQTLCGFRGEEF
jgi:hypothetical protein